MNQPPARQFTDLVVWQKAHALVLSVYAVTRSFPREELFGLTSQWRRAAVSIAANIAEGFRKRGLADKSRFLNTAEGSLDECRYYAILASDLKYMVNRKELLNQADEVARLLHAYGRAIQSKGHQAPS